jgi:hypothetical protein
MVGASRIGSAFLTIPAYNIEYSKRPRWLPCPCWSTAVRVGANKASCATSADFGTRLLSDQLSDYGVNDPCIQAHLHGPSSRLVLDLDASPNVLGTKRSQVQILSPRPLFGLVRAHFVSGADKLQIDVLKRSSSHLVISCPSVRASSLAVWTHPTARAVSAILGGANSWLSLKSLLATVGPIPG